jgi:hypothetical protein
MLNCPHCGNSVDKARAPRSTQGDPLVCPGCNGKSWLRAPFGLQIMIVFLVVTVASIPELLQLPRWASVISWLSGVALAVGLYRSLVRKYGRLARRPSQLPLQ